MVHSISSDHSLNPLGSEALLGQAPVDKAEQVTQRQGGAFTTQPPTLDRTFISKEARAKYEAERAALEFARKAAKLPEAFDADKVSYFKEMVNNGRIHSYLNQLDTDSLVNNLLDSPVKAFLAR